MSDESCKHRWLCLYSERDSDYEPSTSIEWCDRCGTVTRVATLDNRVVSKETFRVVMTTDKTSEGMR